MSDSSSVQLFFVEEVIWGEIPNDGLSPLGPPNLSEFRFTNDSLTQTTETAVTEEIRSDRQVSDIIRTAVSAGGEVGIELSFESHDALLAGALYRDFSTEVNEVGVVASFTTTSPGPGTFTLAASPLPSPNWLLNVVPGQFLRISGSANSPTNDGFFKVASVDAAAGTIIFTSGPASDEVAGTFEVRGQFVFNSVIRKSFTIEKQFSDVIVDTDSPETGVFHFFTGMRVGTASLTIAPGAIINGSFTFEGKQMFSAGVTLGDGAPTEVSTADVLNAVDNITDILINGVEDPDCSFTNVEFTIENNLRAQPCIGQLANSGIGLGRTNVTGTIEAYLLDRAFFERYLNFETVSLSFRATLADDSYIFDFPAIKFITGTAETSGNDADVLVNVEFNAKRDPTSDFMIAINKFPAGSTP